MYRLTLLLTLSLLLWAPEYLPAQTVRPEDIVTVLPKDAIPAILSPSFEDGSEVDCFGIDSETVWLKAENVTMVSWKELTD